MEPNLQISASDAQTQLSCLRNTLQNLSQHLPRMGLSFQLMMGYPQVSIPSWGCSDRDQTGAACITSPTQMLGLW